MVAPSRRSEGGLAVKRVVIALLVEGLVFNLWKTQGLGGTVTRGVPWKRGFGGTVKPPRVQELWAGGACEPHSPVGDLTHAEI